MSNSAGDGEPVGDSVVDADTGQLDVSVYSRSSTRTILGGMPMEWRTCHRQSRSIESNAALRSMKAMKSAVFSEFAGLFSKQSNGEDVIHC